MSIFNEQTGHKIAVKWGHRFASSSALGIDAIEKIYELYGESYYADEMVRLFSKRVASSLRAGHFLSKIGKNKFIAILQTIDLYPSVVRIINRLLDVTEQPYIINDKVMHCLIHIGAVNYPLAGTCVDSLFKCVECALEKAKSRQKKMEILFRKIGISIK